MAAAGGGWDSGRERTRGIEFPRSHRVWRAENMMRACIGRTDADAAGAADGAVFQSMISHII